MNTDRRRTPGRPLSDGASGGDRGVSWLLIGVAVLPSVCLLFIPEARTRDFTDRVLSETTVP